MPGDAQLTTQSAENDNVARLTSYQKHRWSVHVSDDEIEMTHCSEGITFAFRRDGVTDQITRNVTISCDDEYDNIDRYLDEAIQIAEEIASEEWACDDEPSGSVQNKS